MYRRWSAACASHVEVQSHRQWPQCSSDRLTGTYQRTRAKVTVSHRLLCCLCRDQFLQTRFSLLLTIQFPDTLTPGVQQCSLLSSCPFAMSVWFAHALFFCTFSVEACEFVICQVPVLENATHMIGSRFPSLCCPPKNKFITMSSMFAPAHCDCSDSTPVTLTSHQDQPLRSCCQSIKPCEDLQNEKCCFVANTTSSTFNESDSPCCNAKKVISVRQSKSRADQEIGKQFGPVWKVLVEQAKVLFTEGLGAVPLSLRSTHVHKFSAWRIEETALDNVCSNLPLLDADNCLLLLHLTCVFLVCCRRSSLKPVRSMCDGRSFASPLFLRLASRGAFSAVSLSDGFYILRSLLLAAWLCMAQHLAPGLILPWMRSPMRYQVVPLLYCPEASAEPMHVDTGDSTCQGRRSDFLQDAADQGLHMTSGALVPWLAGCSTSWTWTILPFLFTWRSQWRTFGRRSSSSPHYRWRRDALYPFKVQVGIHVATSLTAVTVVLLRTLGVSFGRFFLHKETELKLNYFGKPIENNNVMCLQEVHGKDEFPRLFRCGSRDSSYWVRSFLATRMHQDQPFASTRSSASGCCCYTCDYLPRPRPYCERTVWAEKISDR